MNWRIVEIRFREPEAASFVAARVYRDWYRDAGIEARRLIVDSFLLMDPSTTLRLHAMPFWLLFCVERSADALQRFLAEEPPFGEIDLMLFSHGPTHDVHCLERTPAAPEGSPLGGRALT